MESSNPKTNLDKLNWPSLEERTLQTEVYHFSEIKKEPN